MKKIKLFKFLCVAVITVLSSSNIFSQDFFNGRLMQSTPYRIWHCSNHNLKMSLEDVKIRAAKQGCVTFNEGINHGKVYCLDYFLFEERIYASDDVNYINQLYETFQKYSLKAGVDRYHWIHQKEDAVACAYKKQLQRATDFNSIKSKFEDYRSYLRGIPMRVSNNHNPFKVLEDRIAYLLNSTNNLSSQFEYFNYFYSIWDKYLAIATFNYGITKPICKNIVNSINSTRSFSVINEYESKCSKWANYGNDIYNPTEEVQLYKKIVEYPDGSSLSDREFYKSCETYVDKYSNSGYEIGDYIYKGLQRMDEHGQAKYSIDFLQMTDYLADKTSLEEKIKDKMLSSLKLISDEQRLDLSLYALQSKMSDKNKSLLKTQLKVMETGYTTIKTKSSATRDWVSIIDKYLTCFPTTTHKTELTSLKSKYVAECQRREAEERRRREEEQRRNEEQKYLNAKFAVGDKVYFNWTFGLDGDQNPGIFSVAKWDATFYGVITKIDPDGGYIIKVYDYKLHDEKDFNDDRVYSSFQKMDKRFFILESGGLHKNDN